MTKDKVTHKRWWLRGWLPYIWLMALVLAVYGQTLLYKLTDFGDSTLRDNPTLSHWSDIPRTFVLSVSSQTDGAENQIYRPVWLASIIVNNALQNKSAEQTPATAYHAVNLGFHAVACCLLFALLIAFGGERLPSLLLAAVFAVHPLLVQAVAWVPGRSDSMMTVFVLTALLALVRFTQTHHHKQKNIWLAWHGVAFALALLTKETSVFMPIMGGLYLYFIAHEKLASRTMLTFGAIWLILIAAYCVVSAIVPTDVAQGAWQSAWQGAWKESLNNRSAFGIESLALNWRTMPELVGKMVLPVNKSALTEWSVISSGLGVLVLIVLFAVPFVIPRLIAGIRREWLWFGIAWILVFMITPMLRHPLHTGEEYQYLESQAYLPLVGLLVMIAECCRALFIAEHVIAERRRKAVVITLGGIIAVFALSTVLYSARFRSPAMFWTNVLRDHPQSATANSRVGGILLEQGDREHAEEYLEKAVQLAPQNVRCITSLAAMHLQQKHLNLAEQELRQALTLDSTYSEALYNLGYIMQIRGQRAANDSAFFAQSRGFYEKALRSNPLHANVYANLVLLSISQTRMEEALRWIGEARKRGIDIASTRPELRLLMQMQPQRSP